MIPPEAVVHDVAETARKDDNSRDEQPAHRSCKSHSLSELSNALVQLQAHYHHCGEAASEKCLSAATFVRHQGAPASTSERFRSPDPIAAAPTLKPPRRPRPTDMWSFIAASAHQMVPTTRKAPNVIKPRGGRRFVRVIRAVRRRTPTRQSQGVAARTTRLNAIGSAPEPFAFQNSRTDDTEYQTASAIAHSRSKPAVRCPHGPTGASYTSGFQPNMSDA